jgi:hypothetical protein
MPPEAKQLIIDPPSSEAKHMPGGTLLVRAITDCKRGVRPPARTSCDRPVNTLTIWLHGVSPGPFWAQPAESTVDPSRTSTVSTGEPQIPSGCCPAELNVTFPPWEHLNVALCERYFKNAPSFLLPYPDPTFNSRPILASPETNILSEYTCTLFIKLT